jgi:hypothetical protein
MYNTVKSLVIWSYPVFFFYLLILGFIVAIKCVASKAEKEGYYAAAGPQTCAGKFCIGSCRNAARAVTIKNNPTTLTICPKCKIDFKETDYVTSVKCGIFHFYHTACIEPLPGVPQCVACNVNLTK